MNRDACLLCVPTQIDAFTKFALPNTYPTPHCTAIAKFVLLVKFQWVFVS